MTALIKTADHADCNLRNITNEENGKVVELLKNRIEEYWFNDKPIITIITNQFSECRSSLHVKGCELDEDYLHLNDNNTEIHITSNGVMEIQYDNTDGECFTVRCKDSSEVIFMFY